MPRKESFSESLHRMRYEAKLRRQENKLGAGKWKGGSVLLTHQETFINLHKKVKREEDRRRKIAEKNMGMIID